MQNVVWGPFISETMHFTFKGNNQMHFKDFASVPRTRSIIDSFYVKMGRSPHPLLRSMYAPKWGSRQAITLPSILLYTVYIYIKCIFIDKERARERDPLHIISRKYLQYNIKYIRNTEQFPVTFPLNASEPEVAYRSLLTDHSARERASCSSTAPLVSSNSLNTLFTASIRRAISLHNVHVLTSYVRYPESHILW